MTDKMANSVSELLRSDMECEGLLECVHGLKGLDRDCYEVIVRSDGDLTVDEIADEVGRERSTAYRSVQRLLDAGLVQKEQINYDDGGYYHVYEAAPAGAVTDDMERLLDNWYAKMSELVNEFEEKYDG